MLQRIWDYLFGVKHRCDKCRKPTVEEDGIFLCHSCYRAFQ